MMALYKVNYLFVLVMNKPKFISKPLGVLVKNDIIEVLNFYNNWAYFKYEDQDAYTHSYNLAELTKEKDKESYKNNKDDELSDLIPSMIFKDVYNKATK